MSMVEKEHLGGYVEGGDEATYYPHLWKWLVTELGVRSVIDVGCGEGHAMRFFRDLGCYAMGVDGVAQPIESISKHDYTQGPWVTGPVDLAWSCEFVEHVEECFVPYFVETFRSAKMVLMTHAEPGQAGYHHVNCRKADYWVGVMAGAGFQLDPTFTAAARMHARENKNPWNHFARSGLAFRKTALDSTSPRRYE